MLRIFTRLSTGQKRPVDSSTEALAELEALRKRVHRLEIQAAEAADQVELLRSMHVKLRGRLTGGLRSSEGTDAGAIPYGDKDKLRAYVGLSIVPKSKSQQELL